MVVSGLYEYNDVRLVYGFQERWKYDLVIFYFAEVVD